MSALKKIPSSWVSFALFELICFIVCFILVGSASKLGIFNERFLATGGIWKATAALSGLWLLLSGLALIHHIWSIGPAALIPIIAAIASPFSAFAFCAGYRSEQGLSSLLLLMIAATIMGLAIALGIVKIAELLEDRLYPLFRLMDF